MNIAIHPLAAFISQRWRKKIITLSFFLFCFFCNYLAPLLVISALTAVTDLCEQKWVHRGIIKGELQYGFVPWLGKNAGCWSGMLLSLVDEHEFSVLATADIDCPWIARLTFKYSCYLVALNSCSRNSFLFLLCSRHEAKPLEANWGWWCNVILLWGFLAGGVDWVYPFLFFSFLLLLLTKSFWYSFVVI